MHKHRLAWLQHCRKGLRGYSRTYAEYENALVAKRANSIVLSHIKHALFPQNPAREIGVHIICKKHELSRVQKFGGKGEVEALIAVAVVPNTNFPDPWKPS